MNTEIEILTTAIEKITRDLMLPIQIIKKEHKYKNRQYDAVVKIGQEKVLVEIKKWAPQANIGALINKIKNMPIRGVLIADYINPKMAETLKGEDIQYIDTMGNAYIKTKEIFVYVKGNKQVAEKLIRKNKVSRAFGYTGLKILFAFLCNPELVNTPYRTIAEKTDVAVGTVGWVLYDLRAAGYIRETNIKGKRNRKLIRLYELLNRWVENYPEKLQPKQKIGDFIVEDREWWKKINLNKIDIQFGGEIAAEFYTNGYLQVQNGICYVKKIDAKEVILNGRLRAAEYDNYNYYHVKLYEPFWETGKKEVNKNYVHPLLAYADLIATADPRNIETAQVIYDKYLKYLG